MLDRYEFERHELVLLREFVRCVDDLDRLADAIARHGMITARGELNPAVAEAQHLRIALAAIVGALRLPAEQDDEGPTPVRQPRRYPNVRRIDTPPPSTEATVRTNARAMAYGRHCADDRSPGKPPSISVAELCARASERTLAPVQRAV